MSHETNMAIYLLYVNVSKVLRDPSIISEAHRLELAAQFENLAEIGRGVVLEGLMEEAVKEKS